AAVSLAVLAYHQRQAALQAKEDAEAAAALAAQAQKASETALAAASKASEAAKLLEGTGSDRVPQATALLSEANHAYQMARQDVTQLQTCPNGRRIYPQVGSDVTATAVEPLARALRAAGFVVPPVESMPPQKMPATTEVRYFRENEKSGAVDA